VVNPEISVVVPIFNEELNLDELHRRLRNVLEERLRMAYEVILVDDGSRDGSWSMIEDLNRQDGNVKGIRFSRNFGHHIAITAGLDRARGECIVLMDGDLQDPPEEIPRLYEKLKEGYDVVYAIRQTRDDPLLKKAASKLFHRVFKTLAKVEVYRDSGIFRIMSRQAAESLRNCRERSRFITALMSWTGFSHAGLETKRDARRAGRTKYNLVRSVLLAIDGITSFSYFPLRIATYMGLFVALISAAVGLYMVIKKVFFGIAVSGYASLMVAILFVGGAQLLIIGIMGEYVGRIYTEVKDRPMYILRDVTESKKEKTAEDERDRNTRVR
jgi:dolichol-phosphate mannosyltransferase